MLAWYIITYITTVHFGVVHFNVHGPYIGSYQDCLKLARTYEKGDTKAECRTSPTIGLSWVGPSSLNHDQHANS